MEVFAQLMYKKVVCPDWLRVINVLLLLLSSLAIQGYKKPLEDKDLWSLNADDKSEVIVQKLQKEWDKQKQRGKL